MSHHGNESVLSKRQVTVTDKEQRCPLLAAAQNMVHGMDRRAAEQDLNSPAHCQKSPASPKWDAGVLAGNHHAAVHGETQRDGSTALTHQFRRCSGE